MPKPDNLSNGVGSYSRKTFRTRLLTAASTEPWRGRIMKILKILGYRDEQWLRVVMNSETNKLISRLDTGNFDALEISGTAWKTRVKFRSYKTLSYPDFDICKSTTEEKFDLIVAEQVFEHLLWPYRAGRNVYSMLRDDGYFLITTPFMVRVHGYPIDCTRWTETGIKHFLAECGFSIYRIKTGSWGNISCVKSNLWYWRRYHPLFHSLRNQADFPVNVWALAQKHSE